VATALYVETTLHGDLAVLWHRTQDAREHARWDLRFPEIEDVTAQTPTAPRTFRYALRLPGLTVAGLGTSVGEHTRPDGTRTSALRFASPSPLSLIRRGSGWWRYVPTPEGTRFLTGYDYEPGWGRLGALVDRAGFRRLVGWATAWSFDRLRLWVDDGVPPEVALRRGLADAALRAAAALAAARGGRPGAPAVLLVLGAAFLPPLPGAPRAGRCLRHPPDRTGRTPASSLSTLEAPS